MNGYRSAAVTVAAFAAGLSLAACSAGSTAASQATSSPAASAPAASSSAPGSSGSARTVSVGGSIGRFPIPSGAKVIENLASGREIVIILGSVSPSKVSGFYTSALPRDGYKITSNSLGTGTSYSGAAIEFTGHGYKGTIGAVSNIASSGVSLGGSTKNVVGITLTRR